MSFLVRKITRSKWPAEDVQQIDIGDFSADAITSCLRTSGNTLSTWEIDSLAKIDEAVLALASTFTSLDSTVVVWIEKDALLNQGFKIADSDGETPVQDLVKTHKDVTELNYDALGVFAQLVFDALRNKRYTRYTSSKLKSIIRMAVGEGRLTIDSLHTGIQNKLSS